MLAARLQQVQPSPTLMMTAKAAQLISTGQDVISLCAGEPDFATPNHIIAAAIAAMNEGLTKYTAVDGMPALKQAVQLKFCRDNSLDYDLAEITTANGGKQIIFNALMATLDAGDEVIIPSPYWVSYPDMVHLFGGVPKIVATQESTGFKLTAAQLEAAITPKTKWVIINSPANPTGEVYNKAELTALASVLRAHPHVMVMSDDIYEYLIYDNLKFVNVLMVAPDLKERVLIVNGVSKSYSMTGWRLGYGAGPKALIKAMTMIQSQCTSNASSISQAAAIVGIIGDQAFLEQWRHQYQQRRDLCVKAINAIPGLETRTPGGAFYLYINCQGVIGKTTPTGKVLTSDQDFAEYLLDSALVAVVSGNAFGLSPYIRISYATSQEMLQKACERIHAAVMTLS